MAATLDLILITTDNLSIHNIVRYLNEFYDLKIQISKTTQIDNWLWEGECGLSASDTMDSCLMNGKIVVVGLRSPLFKDSGVFVEKIDEKIIYTFWINTETYPELDVDIWNKDIYLKIFGGIEEVIKEFAYRVDTIAIGIETNLIYKKDRTGMIKKSDNINAWGFDQSMTIDDLSGFSRSRIGDRDLLIPIKNKIKKVK